MANEIRVKGREWTDLSDEWRDALVGGLKTSESIEVKAAIIDMLSLDLSKEPLLRLQ